MSRTLTVEGDLATVDSRTQISTQGSVTAPSLIIPSNVRKIVKIIAACTQDGAAVGSGVFFIRLGGAGVLKGEQTIMVGAGGTIAVQTGSDQNYPVVSSFVLDDADIDVSPSDSISISAEMAGSDLGTAGIAITLVFA